MKKRFSNGSVAIASAGTIVFLFLFALSLPGLLTTEPQSNAASPITEKQAHSVDGTASLPPPLATPPTPPIPTRTITAITVTPQSTQAPVAPAPIQAQENYGAWSYKAGQGAEGLAANVHYDDSSVEALKNYAAANRELANQLTAKGGIVQVGITFRNYITPDQFRRWVGQVGLDVQESTLRAIDEGGTRITIGIMAQNNDILPQDLIDTHLSGKGSPAAARRGSYKLQGVYYTGALVDARQLPQVGADPLVFLADVTPNIVRNVLTTGSMEGASQARILVVSPFAKMEEFGLDNFR